MSVPMVTWKDDDLRGVVRHQMWVRGVKDQGWPPLSKCPNKATPTFEPMEKYDWSAAELRARNNQAMIRQARLLREEGAR